MLNYNFTNDLRTSTDLFSRINDVAKHVKNDTLTEQVLGKSKSNSYNTVKSYFYIQKDSGILHEALKGNSTEVVFNFMKKFQFPNHRDKKLYKNQEQQGIIFKPYQVILRLLYTGYLTDNQFYLTKDEILEFIFANTDVVKNAKFSDYPQLLDHILHRRDNKNYQLLTKDSIDWRASDRQLGEMLNVLNYTGFSKFENGKVKFSALENGYMENSQYLNEIMFDRNFLLPTNKTFDDFKKEYATYFDLDSSPFKMLNDEDLGNKEYVFVALKVLKQYNLIDNDTLKNLQDKDYALQRFKVSTGKMNTSGTGYGILYKVDPAITNQTKDLSSKNERYYNDQVFEFDGIDYYVTNQWKLDSREKFSKWIIDLIEMQRNLGINSIKRSDTIQEIRFGAPGTGKSYSIKNIIRKSYPEYEENDSNPFVLRTTIHGEYSHFDFVGNVMPISKNGVVGYEFTEGIFTTALIRAMLYKGNDVYLIIEEMSRGDIASIFGDIFQLLDRNEQGVSEYRIDNSLISDELVKNGAKSKDDDKIYLPSNLHIIGTVNTSDQNVNVLDTAFKRRFSFIYESVKPSYDGTGTILNSETFTLGGKLFEWNQFYLAINKFIVSDLGLSEDKQLGQFFVKFNEGVDVNETIKNKVLHYLWEDVQNASMSDETSIFNKDIRAFSILYDKFDQGTSASEIFSVDFLETYDGQKVELRKQQNE
ncbi:hypothetical protein [Streptococcus salivarius]|uniref:hypothetical protein n=1 Tax=Streptococcus salivarius TaxID=1304 RepID=UPI001BDB4CAF|nr:hypothetical protein [Streptococcus salivarius]MBT0913120.1 hypothetical protein [Streptococcus salivarius]